MTYVSHLLHRTTITKSAHANKMPFRLKDQTANPVAVVETPKSAALNLKQANFCREYVIDYNGTKAAIRAGYSEGSAASIAHEILIKPEIQEEIARLDREHAANQGITKDRIMRELARLGFANMQDYMKVDSQGYPHLDFSALTREQAAALIEVTVDEYSEPGMEEIEDDEGETKAVSTQRQVKKVKFKLADKRAALVDLGRHIGMFRDPEERGAAATDRLFIRTIVDAMVAIANKNREKQVEVIDV